ncbi:Homeobox protein pal-1 [Caenorhabditis elegans]|uniref:Homeobox protein pal-1 n=1 Tax=Caenorhabditis elegans TaxID=6239 RepID=PAL1_CAEEL|nr:Homeobox protein pal-1 [Caenorhabditis elegans]P34766.2 RecName: Full=Homeobox protein pal-1; AltName: Full=Caudal homolog 1; AltName: Full=Homeobox protein ceh-3; AltName: Full=Posterior alae in males protein 1 [Caenorhabditis elegans]CAA86322.2 Homeobox protein pal-1 [Caenorhabditis elegans]|eukprot:NP_001021209.1 Homeobox protein pal-1 [Caenorhabditis elegans]
MSVDVKSDFSENESSSTPSPTTVPADVTWPHYPMMPFMQPHPLREKMLQPTFDPQIYGRWSQMGDTGFYGHPDLYPFGLPQLAANGQIPAVEAVDVKPPLSNGSSSSDSGMYPSPSDMMTPFPSTSSGAASSSELSAAAAAAANYQMRAATCYQQSVWPFMDYQQFQGFSWKMPLGNNHGKDRRSSSDGKTLPTGPGTNNVRVRTADKYRMVYSDYQRLELEKEFHTSPFITSDRKSQLSTMLSLTERQIKIWFQNRRAKDRRDKQKIRL